MTGDSEYQRIDQPRKSRLAIRLRTIISGGTEGTVSRVDVTLHTDASRRSVGTMITKELEVLSDLPETSFLEIKKKYSFLKKRGFPVVPTLRTNTGLDRILMTDLTLSGKLILIDKHSPLSKLNMPVSNLKELHAQLRGMALRAFNEGNGVVLGSDSYSLVYDPAAKIAKIALVDIGRGTYIVGNYKAKGRNHAISEELVSRNAEHAIKYYFS